MALLAYLAVRGPTDGPLFLKKDRTAITWEWLISRLRDGLSACGIDSKAYAGHSFRIGAATTAAEKGIEDSTIMLGRWKSEAFQLYVRTPREALAAISGRLATH